MEILKWSFSSVLFQSLKWVYWLIVLPVESVLVTAIEDGEKMPRWNATEVLTWALTWPIELLPNGDLFRLHWIWSLAFYRIQCFAWEPQKLVPQLNSKHFTFKVSNQKKCFQWLLLLHFLVRPLIWLIFLELWVPFNSFKFKPLNRC